MDWDILGKYGYHFSNLDLRLQKRFWKLVSEHAHSLNSATSGLSALPGTAKPFAATRAMSRFLKNDDIPFPALIEPAQDAVRDLLTFSPSRFVLLVTDWCMFGFNSHKGKPDRCQRSHKTDLGYDLGSVIAVDANDGRPLGPMEFRLRTANGILSTRIRHTSCPPGHLDEVLEAMEESRRWNLKPTPIHIIDREADSVGHYRQWAARGHKFLVRADVDRLVTWRGKETHLTKVLEGISCDFQDVLNERGEPEIVTLRQGTGRVRVAETAVILHRPAKHFVHIQEEEKQEESAKRDGTAEATPLEMATGETPQKEKRKATKKKVEIPGPPIPLRLVVTRVVDEVGKVHAEWLLFTNVEVECADAGVIGKWYAWRWVIETFHKLLKSAGQNAEEWQQDSGEAFLRRLMVASMSCLTVWHLQKEEGEEAARLRKILVRLSGRQMKHKVESTAPALLAGLEKLLAIDDLLEGEDLAEVLALARKVLPQLFRSG